MANVAHLLPLYCTEAADAFDKVQSGEWDKDKFCEWAESCRESASNDGYDLGYCNAQDIYGGEDLV